MFVVDAYVLYAGIIKNTFQGALIVLVHVVAKGNQKLIINEVFYRYLNKV